MAKKEKTAVCKEGNAKLAALQTAMSKIEKQFGKGSIMRLGDQTREKVAVIPSGSIKLDTVLGVGGYPRGRIIEIYGQESSGKTTLALHAIAECQKQGGCAVFIDAEHALDTAYASSLGVDVDSLYLSQPDNGEQAMQIADQVISSGAVDIIVIDSVAALTPKAEIEGEMGDSKVGLQARLMSQALRKLTATIARSRTCCFFINSRKDWCHVWTFRNHNRRQCPEILLHTASGSEARFASQGRRNRIWLHHACTRGKEQGGTSLPCLRP